MANRRRSGGPPACTGRDCECLATIIVIVAILNFMIVPLLSPHKREDRFGYSGGYQWNSGSALDLSSDGLEWAPMLDRDTIRCTNLEMLTEWKGETLRLYPPELALWDSLQCKHRLFNFTRDHPPKKLSRQGLVCRDLQTVNHLHLVPDRNGAFGLRQASARSNWDAYNCGCYFTPSCAKRSEVRQVPDVDPSGTKEGLAAAVAQRSGPEILSPASGDLEIVALVLGTTAVKVRFTDHTSTPLVKFLLPSLLRTAEQGFEYWVVVAYDVGDLFFDDARHRSELEAWFRDNVTAPAATHGITIQLALVGFLNVLRKPGPVFNFAAACAIEDGADYVYRVNDDTELETRGWAQAMTAQLKAFKPPNLGVVGPVGSADASSNRGMITHDLVHRTHVAIFGLHYPQSLSDWWMDDWISHVYPPENAQKLSDVRVIHHMELVAEVHDTVPGDPVRYDVDFRHKDFLSDELFKGYRTIRKFQSEHCKRGTCDVKPSERKAKKGGGGPKLEFKIQSRSGGGGGQTQRR